MAKTKKLFGALTRRGPHRVLRGDLGFAGLPGTQVAIEAIRQPDGNYLAYTDNGREYTGVEVLSWVKEVEERGAGEILLTSIDCEGTGNGFDYKLIKMISKIIYRRIIEVP